MVVSCTIFDVFSVGPLESFIEPKYHSFFGDRLIGWTDVLRYFCHVAAKNFRDS